MIEDEVDPVVPWLSAVVDDHLRERGAVYALIDRYVALPAPVGDSVNRCLQGQRQTAQVLRHALFGQATHRAPVLLSFQEEDRELMEQLITLTGRPRQADPPHWPGHWLLASPHVSMVQLRAHLQTLLDVRLHGYPRAAFLRYYDPWVLDVLWHWLNESQRARWMGPIEHWHFVRRDGSLHKLSAPQELQEPRSQDSMLVLDDRASAALLRAEVVNAAYQVLYAWQKPAAAFGYPAVDAAVVAVQQLGLRDTANLAAGAAAMLSWPQVGHGAFWDHPQVLRAIQASREGVPLRDYIEEHLAHVLLAPVHDTADLT